MDFDEEAIGASGYGGSGHGGNFIAATGAVRRIGDHREMRKFFDDGDSCDVEGVAGVGLEGTDAAFAEDDVVIAAGENVFGTEEKLFHGGGHAALEEDRFADFAESAEKIIILHVAGADLEDVDIFGHHTDLRKVHDFADGKETEFVGGFAHELEACFAEALKSVGRGARLEGPGAKNLCAGFGDAFGHGQNLFARFDGAGAGGDNDFIAADFYAAAKIDDGAFGFELTAGELEGLRDAHDFAHAFE